MKLFHWRSPTMRDYSDGDIIVMAGSLEDAKNVVREQFREVANTAWLEAVVRDMEATPYTVLDQPGAILIAGSA